MKATMFGGPCQKSRQAERAVRSTGLVTASACGAVRVTGDVPRSLEAAAHSRDNSVGAKICAALLSTTTFSNVLLIEFAAVITATISDLADLLAKAIGRACNADFDKTEQWLELEPSAATQTSYGYRVPWDRARRMANLKGVGQGILVSCRGSVLPTRIDETQH